MADESSSLILNMTSGTENDTNATAAIQNYIENACNDAVNRVVAVWFIQLLANITLMPPNASLSLDEVLRAPQTASLKDAIIKMLSESTEILNGVAAALAAKQADLIPALASIDPLKNNGNILYLLSMGIFIFFMQSGFALMEIGMVRTKNVANSIWKNALYSFSSAVGYWLFGMGLSFGASDGRFAGTQYLAFHEMPQATGQGVDLMLYFFEYVFCTTAGAIMTGAIAERAQIGAYILWTFLTASFTYPIVVHWGWMADGWLKFGALYTFNGNEVRIGYEDFAGSGIVHACGGVAALVAVMFVGPRIGRYTPDGKVNEIKGHSVTFVAAGSMTIFTGFLAFNAGSEITLTNEADALLINRAVVNTVLSGAGGCIFVALFGRIFSKRWPAIPMLCGGLSGNVAICCSCHTVAAWGAFCIGGLAGLFYLVVSKTLIKLRLDDAGDVVAVHWGGGFIGVVGLAFFKIDVGILYAWNHQSGVILGWQLLGFTVISLWSAGHTYVIFYVMKMFNMVRVDPETELVGLDYGCGHEIPYPNEAYVSPCVHSGSNNSSDGRHSGHSGTSESNLDKVYDQLFETEMAKYTQDYINKPGWSHPVLGGVLWDLSWISVVRSRRKEMQAANKDNKHRRPNSNNHVYDVNNNANQQHTNNQAMQLYEVEFGTNNNSSGTNSEETKRRNPTTVDHVDERPRFVDAATNVTMKHSRSPHHSQLPPHSSAEPDNNNRE